MIQSFRGNQTEKVIAVSDKETRRRLVSTTNAFSIGAPQHRKVEETLNWISLPMPDTYGYVAYIKKADEELDKTCKRYLELLKEEMSF